MKRLFAYGVAAALLTAAAAFWMTAPNSSGMMPNGAAFAQDGEIDTSIVQEMTMGNPDAKVTVIEYASFTCPHCQRFHETVLKDLKKNYIDTGKIAKSILTVSACGRAWWPDAVVRSVTLALST